MQGVQVPFLLYAVFTRSFCPSLVSEGLSSISCCRDLREFNRAECAGCAGFLGFGIAGRVSKTFPEGRLLKPTPNTWFFGFCRGDYENLHSAQGDYENLTQTKPIFGFWRRLRKPPLQRGYQPHVGRQLVPFPGLWKSADTAVIRPEPPGVSWGADSSSVRRVTGDQVRFLLSQSLLELQDGRAGRAGCAGWIHSVQAWLCSLKTGWKTTQLQY